MHASILASRGVVTVVIFKSGGRFLTIYAFDVRRLPVDSSPSATSKRLEAPPSWNAAKPVIQLEDVARAERKKTN
jgi:hypothetical protein